MPRRNLRALESALAEPPLLLSVKEAAHLLGLGLSSIYTMIARGEIESVRILDRHLIKREAVEKLIANAPSVKIAPPRPKRGRRSNRD